MPNQIISLAIEIMKSSEHKQHGMCGTHCGDHAPLNLFSQDRSDRYSIGGAIMRASFELGYGRGVTDPDVSSVFEAIHNFCEKDKSMKPHLCEATLNVLEGWNDVRGRTKQDVIEKLELWNSKL